MAPSEWTPSVCAVRDTLLADYTAPGANPTQCVTCHPPITVSPFLLALLVSYYNWTLWRCGHMWPYVGMSSFGTSAKCKLVRKPHAVFHQHKAFCLLYLSLLQSQDSLPHNMACIIGVSLYIYIQSIWPRMVLEHNRRFSLEEPTKKMRRNETTRGWESTQLRGSTTSPKERVRPKVGKDRVCVFVVG